MVHPARSNCTSRRRGNVGSSPAEKRQHNSCEQLKDPQSGMPRPVAERFSFLSACYINQLCSTRCHKSLCTAVVQVISRKEREASSSRCEQEGCSENQTVNAPLEAKLEVLAPEGRTHVQGSHRRCSGEACLEETLSRSISGPSSILTSVTFECP